MSKAQRSSGPAFGLIYHYELRSEEVRALQENDHKAFMFWMFLRTSIFRSAHTWPISTPVMARKFGVDRRAVQRWSKALEEAGLLHREVGQHGKATQRFTLIDPPSVRKALEGLRAAAPEPVSPSGKRREDLEQELEGLQRMVETHGDDYGPAWVAQSKDLIATLELELEAF